MGRGMSRLLSFDAIDNFRDYGDYATAAGRRVKPGRLYRSAHHARASDADLARLGTLGVCTLVDLRRPGERRHQPSRRPVGSACAVIESDHDDGGEAPHITFLKTSDLTEASGRAFMQEAYRRLPHEAPHLDLFARYFRALGEADGPVLIHCAAGKDRTGLLAALTHHLLGVSREDMIEDYLLTNRAVDLERRAPDIARQLHAMTGRKASHGAVVAFLGVEADFLDVAFRTIEAEHGSLDAYLERALGVHAALRDRIGERLAA
jgi:protein-tyrosine phosphatase